jgi:hypothetical protein
MSDRPRAIRVTHAEIQWDEDARRQADARYDALHPPKPQPAPAPAPRPKPVRVVRSGPAPKPRPSTPEREVQPSSPPPAPVSARPAPAMVEVPAEVLDHLLATHPETAHLTRKATRP